MNRILVVDDSLSVRKVLERLLSSHADVRVAVSAEDALAQLDAGMPTPDLLISDVLMPGMDGLELAQTLRARPATAQMPIVLISGILDDTLTRQANDAGVYAVIRKPFTAEELQPVILQALAASSALPVLPGDSAFVPKTPHVPHNGRGSEVQNQAARPDTSIPNMAPPSIQDQAIQWDNRAVPVHRIPSLPTASPVSALPELDSPVANATHRSLLSTLMKKPGVMGSMVTTQDGSVLAFEGDLTLPAVDLAMYARFFASSADVLGKRLGTSPHEGVQIDFAPRTLLILPLDGRLLICLLADANSSSMVRYALQRALAG